MTALSLPRHPVIADALALATTWCAGHIIDEAPALTHAVKVAATLGQHMPDPPVELIAAALLHDAPYFAPGDVDLDAVLTHRLGSAVTSTVRAMEREHADMNGQREPRVDTSDAWTLHAIAADKIVAISSVLRRAGRAEDVAAYWRRRAAFVNRVPFFRAYCEQAKPHLPAAMGAELDRLVAHAERATANAR